MNNCKRSSCCENKTNFWSWWRQKEKTFTVDEVAALLERVKEFNCGAIDDYLSNHVDRVFDEWSQNIKDQS